jgi:hypothetical protein
METRYDSSGRVQPIQFGNMATPGTCLLCNRIGHDNTEIFASLGVELEFYGIAYLCLDCCAELADFILFKSPEAYNKLNDKYAALKKDWDILRKQLAEAKGLIDVRIDTAGDREPSGDGSASIPLFEVESDADFIDSILNSDESVSAESGTK